MKYLLLISMLLLTGCKNVIWRIMPDGDGHAYGAGCYQARKSIEQCMIEHTDNDPAAIYNGWKEMHDYMQKK